MAAWITDEAEAEADLKTGRSSAEQSSSSVEANVTSAVQSSDAYAVQSCSSAKGFRGTAQCSNSVIDFSIRG